MVSAFCGGKSHNLSKSFNTFCFRVVLHFVGEMASKEYSIFERKLVFVVIIYIQFAIAAMFPFMALLKCIMAYISTKMIFI